MPGLCCQALGGRFEWAEDIATAWLLYYLSAHIMDNVQDEDELEPWAEIYPPGFALNVSSGYYFSASLALNQLLESQLSTYQAIEIINDFYRSFLVMGEGQQMSFLTKVPTLDQYWQIAGSKSGIFFALACRSGAHLVSDDETILEDYQQYGFHLGMLVQISDDLEEIGKLKTSNLLFNSGEFIKSLAIVYALEVLPKNDKEGLLKAIEVATRDGEYLHEIWKMVEESGAAMYIETQIEFHRYKALEALDSAQPLSPAKESLITFIESFHCD